MLASSAADGTRKKRGYDLGRNDDRSAGRIHPVNVRVNLRGLIRLHTPGTGRPRTRTCASLIQIL